ncbi:unnamed protein product, partial [Mesorhabditis spiculigera]
MTTSSGSSGGKGRMKASIGSGIRPPRFRISTSPPRKRLEEDSDSSARRFEMRIDEEGGARRSRWPGPSSHDSTVSPDHHLKMPPQQVVSKSYNKHECPVSDYCNQLTIQQEPVQIELQRETLAKHEMGRMLGAPEHFIRLIKGKKALDVGTFTGGSALAWALALPADGQVVSMDVSHAALNSIGKPILQKAPEALKKIDFRLAPALETLDSLIASGASGTFDFAFIDADKTAYPEYYAKTMTLLRSGGVILVDNALRGGKVALPEKDESCTAIDACNRQIFADTNSNSFLINVGDGLHVAFKA